MSDLFFQLDPDTIHDRIREDRDAAEVDEDTRGETVKRFRDYARGHQLRTLTDKQRDMLDRVLENLNADNVCGQVISEGAARLRLKELTCATDETVNEWLHEDLWTKNHFPKLANYTHRAALRDKDFFLLPAWSTLENRIIIYKELAWDGESGVFIAYDEMERPEYAVKEWVDRDGNHRRLVWVENAIYRFVSTGGLNWEPYQLPEDNKQWPVPWVKLNGDPLHIPYAHFDNESSEIAGGVLGFQDQINDTQYALSACMRMTAYQVITATNLKLPVNKDGTTKVPAIGGGSMLINPETGTWGNIPAGSLAEIRNTLLTKKQTVAAMTRTPMHQITGQDWPSGEALYRAELPAVNKADEQVARFKPAWATLAHRATEISNTFGGTELNEDAIITAEYDSTDRLEDLKRFMAQQAFWTAAQQAVNAGYPLKLYLKEQGWNPDQIKEFEAESQAEQDRQAEQDAANVNSLLRDVGRQREAA